MFDIYTTVDLSYLGDDWKDCYLKFHPFTVDDLNIVTEIDSMKDNVEAIAKKAAQVLSDKFIDGYAIDQGQKVQVTKETIKLFPLGTMLEILNQFSSGLDKKKENKLETSSEVTESPPSPS